MTKILAEREQFFKSLPKEDQREMIQHHARQCYYRHLEREAVDWCKKHPPMRKLGNDHNSQTYS